MTTTPTPPTSTDPAEEHGFELKRRPTWLWIALGLAVVIAALVIGRFAFGPDEKSANEIAGATLYVATQEGFAAEQAVIEFVAREVAPKYGIKVEFKGLGDSTTINRAVSEGEVAGTTFQHKLWLDQVLEANPDFQETATEPPIFRWAFGIFSEKYDSVEDIPAGSDIVVPSDPANEAQALFALSKAGLLELRPGADPTLLTQKDIVANPRNLKIIPLEYAAGPRALKDVAAAVGANGDFTAGGTSLDDLIFNAPPADEFAGVLTVGTKWKDTENIKKLTAAFHDPAVQEFIATDPDVKGLLLPFP